MATKFRHLFALFAWPFRVRRVTLLPQDKENPMFTRTCLEANESFQKCIRDAQPEPSKSRDGHRLHKSGMKLSTCVLQRVYFHTFLTKSYFKRTSFTEGLGREWVYGAAKIATQTKGPGGGGGSHIKRAGMLIVPLRGQNPQFGYRLGCSKQNTYICIQHGTF